MPILGATGSASEYAYRSNIVDYPDPFDWPDQLNVDPGNVYIAGYAKITGIKSKLKIRVSAGSSYSLYANAFDNGQTITFDSTQETFDSYLNPNERFKPGFGLNNSFYELIGNNQSVNLKINTPRVVATDFSKTYTTNVSIGNSVQDWIVTTRAFDATPNPFSFTSIGSTTTLTTVESNQITVAGIETGFTHSSQITAGIGTIVVNGVPQGTSFDISNGDNIKLQKTTSNLFNTDQDVTLQVGTFSTTWSVRTEQENLDIIFSSDFTDQTNLNLSTNVISNQITLTGFSLNSALPVTLSNTSAAYEIERGAAIVKTFTDPAANVTNNDKIRVRLPSSGSYSTTVSTTVSVGNSSADWNLTTRSAPPPLPPDPDPGPPDPPAPSTVSVGRYYNSTIADHLYSIGNPITGGTVTVNDRISAGGSLSWSGGTIFLGEPTATIDRQAVSPTDPVIRVRMTLPYQMNPESVTLLSTTPSGGSTTVIITSSTVTNQGISGDTTCRVYFIRFRNNATPPAAAYARDYRFTYNLNGYVAEGSFKVFPSQQSGTQLLVTSYDNRRTNHETAFLTPYFAADESSAGYTQVQSLGYAYPGNIVQPPGTQPLYKLVFRSTSTATINNNYDTLLTTSATEALNTKNSGWIEISSAPGFPGFIGRPYAWVPL